MNSNLEESRTLKILGIGNPLLDMVADIPDKAYIDKYGLALNDMHLAQERHMPIYKELPELYHVKYIPGGATQNTMRVCQALLKEPNTVTYSGCVGGDAEGKSMQQLLEEAGVVAKYCVDSSAPTGTCAVLVHNYDRALCTNLGAANKYPLTFIQNTLWKTVEEVDIIYSAAFFATVCPEGMLLCAQHCSKNNKVYCLCLSALFIIELFQNEFKKLIPYTDILFGNGEEYELFAKCYGLKATQLEEIAREIVELPKINTKRSRIIVITQGSGDVIVAIKWVGSGVKILKLPVFLVPNSEIVDSNGCGDAFVGGFLYGLAKRMDLDRCVFYGNYAAGNVIQHSGCSFSLESALII